MLIYRDNLRNINKNNLNLIIAPTNIYLPLFKNESLNLCCQDIALNENLNLTGDISIEQLLSLDIKYTLIGHYDRRKYYHETEEDILKKIKNALKHNIKIIYCIGETKEELDRKVEYLTLEKQIARILNNIPIEKHQDIIIAYEPAYLIGSNITGDIKKIATTITFIKNLITNYYGTHIDVVFGGNINPDNIKDFMNIKNLDGFIIGSSCLDLANLQKIMEYMT